MAGLRVAVKKNDRLALAGNQVVNFDPVDLDETAFDGGMLLGLCGRDGKMARLTALEQGAEAGEAVVDAAFAQRMPGGGLVAGHHRAAELASSGAMISATRIWAQERK